MPANNTRYMRAYYHRKKAEVIASLGGKCIFCDESDINQLRIDHKNGYKGKRSPNGSRGGMRNLWDIITLIKAGKSDQLQLVCHNCDLNREYRP